MDLDDLDGLNDLDDLNGLDALDGLDDFDDLDELDDLDLWAERAKKARADPVFSKWMGGDGIWMVKGLNSIWRKS